MKHRNFIFILAVLLFMVYTSSCKGIDADVQTAAPETSEAVTTTALSTIANGDFGGVLYESSRMTAATAAPIPDMTYTRTSALENEDADDSSDTSDTETAPGDEPADTTTAVTTTAVTTTTTRKTVPEPDMVISETTTAAETTTSAAVTTTTPPQTSDAPEETAAPVIQTGSTYPRNTYTALNHSYVKAVWISYIELSAFYRKSESDFREGFAQMLDNCASLGLNTVYVHVRAFGDAYYYSELFPFTKQLSGALGTRTDYDPLKIMVSEAHNRGFSLHAWINPLRLGVTSDMAAVSSDYPVGKWYNGPENGTYIVNVNGTYFLNPAYDEVRKLIGDGVREIVSNYNVDGIHIDDYFYPTMDTSFDSAAYSGSGYASIESFRVDKCSAMVREMYNAAHECGSALFGAAPQGNNYNNLYALYADTKAWAKGGYIDYFTPQIYYGFEHGAVPFTSNVDEWLSIVAGTGIKLYPGLAVYKCGTEDKWAGTGKSEWQNTDTMLKRQKEYADKAGCSGIALYSYNYLFSPSYTNDAVQAEIGNLKPLLAE